MSTRRRGRLHDRWASCASRSWGRCSRRRRRAASWRSRWRRWRRRRGGIRRPARRCCFGTPTIERWYYQARNAGLDRVGALRKKVRKDSGTPPSMTPSLRAALRDQYEAHPTWSYQLHADNLEVVCEGVEPAIGACPSYTTVRRYMHGAGLHRRPRAPNANRPGAERARARARAAAAAEYGATRPRTSTASGTRTSTSDRARS